VLYDAGIINAATLAAAEPDELVHSYIHAVALRPDDDGFRPTTEQAAEWIAAATRLTRE
jgi:hypothetical protein